MENGETIIENTVFSSEFHEKDIHKVNDIIAEIF